MFQRKIKEKILNAFMDTPVVMIAGPRQCGKTTLAKEIMHDDWQYITFDDLTQLELANKDPVGFIRDLSARHVILDEVQRVPDLFLSIKQSVDENREPGRFLLTGSANALMLPKLADSLAGRLEVIRLMPLSECEIQGMDSTFLEKVFSGILPTTKQVRIRNRLIQKIISGGFPESLTRTSDTRRTAWHIQYINSIVQKDIKEMNQLEHLELMPKLISVISNQVGQLINYTQLAGRIGLSRQTMLRYLKLLEQLFIFEDLPAWHRNANKRVQKTPKMHIIDTGLLCVLQRINHEKLAKNPNMLGSLVESYVFCELKRIASWLEEPLYFYHYRDKDKVEVDIVLETLSGAVIGIEVKALATLRSHDFQGLERLREMAGDDFFMGMILYDGDHSSTYSKNIHAVPIASIWE